MTPQECDEKWPELKVARMAARFGVWEEVVRIYNRIWWRDRTCVGTELFESKAYGEWMIQNQAVRKQIMKELAEERTREKRTVPHTTKKKKKKEGR